MANGFTLPGIKKQSFSDYLSNTNSMAEQDYSTEPEASSSPFTMNNMRAENAFRARPEEYNLQDPKPDTLMPEMKEGDIPTEILPLKPETSEPPATKEKGGILDSIKSFFKGKPGTDEEKYGKPLIGNLKGDEFMALAGALSEALAPDTAQGRAGGAISRFAQPMVKRRKDAETAAPEKALAARLTEAKIRDLDKTEDPKTAIAWYLKQNPEASEKDVIAFKKSIEADKEGSYWRTTSDDGTITIYKGGEEVHKSEPGRGKTKAADTLYKTEEGFKPASEAKDAMPYNAEKTPSPVTWTTATKGLTGRFGKQDATGNIIITPELQQSHRVAQKKLVELKAEGLDPLDAVNKSEDYARQVETDFWQYTDDALNIPKGDRKKYLEQLKKSYKSRFGYVPRMRPRS